MPGIFGIYSKSDRLTREDLRCMAERMAASMRHTPWLHTETWGTDRFFGGRVHLGVYNPEPQPHPSDDGSSCLFFEGEAFASDSASPLSPNMDTVGADIQSAPSRTLQGLDGTFQLALYDTKHHQLTLCLDRFALRPLYFLETSKFFAFAAEPKALLAISSSQPTIDKVSLREYLSFGWILSDRSWWEGIRAVPAASVWKIPDDSEPRRYWNCDDIRIQHRNETDVIDELEGIWESEVKGRVRDGTSPFLLSGGVDSRMVLSTLVSNNAPARAITFGDAESSDLPIARMCARRAGIQQDVVILDQNNWWHGREEALWRIDGMVPTMHLHAVASSEYGRTGNRICLVNLAGNPLFAGDFITPAKAGTWPTSLSDVLQTFYQENPWVRLDEVVDSSKSDLKGDLIGPSSTCFWLRRRTARFTLNGPLSTASHYESSFVSPTLRVLECVLGGVPDNRRRRAKFYAHWARRHHGAFFDDIPWQKTGRGLHENFVQRFRRTASQPFRSWMSKSQITKNGIANYQSLARSMLFREQERDSGWLVDDCLDGGASRFMDQQRESFTDPSMALRLWSLELYLRQVDRMSCRHKDALFVEPLTRPAEAS